MSSPDFHKLYELILQREQHLIDSHQKRFAFFASMNTAIFAATVAGFMRAEGNLQHLLLIIGPLLVIMLSEIGRSVTIKTHQIVLETITIKAKFEQALGLTTSRAKSGDENCFPWPTEPFIATRYLVSWKEYPSSEEFVRQQTNEGYQYNVNLTFRCFQGLAFALIAVIIAIQFYPSFQLPA